MTRPLSKELKEKIVSAYDRGVGTIKEVAGVANISVSTQFDTAS